MKRTILVFLAAALASAQPNPPELLTAALRRVPGLTILDPASDLRNAPLNDLNVPPARSWLERDFDRDGHPDIVAVVTARASQRTRFGVLAVLSSRPGRSSWVIPLGPEPLYGIAYYADNYETHSVFTYDRIVPLSCLACDANGWFRWSGRAFEPELYTAADTLTITDREIFNAPSKTSRILAKSGRCARVKPIDFRGSDVSSRWYLIETKEQTPKRGWIPAEALTGDDIFGIDECKDAPPK